MYLTLNVCGRTHKTEYFFAVAINISIFIATRYQQVDYIRLLLTKVAFQISQLSRKYPTKCSQETNKITSAWYIADSTKQSLISSLYQSQTYLRVW